MLLLTLRGTPTLYYGDEIGMRQVPIRAGAGARPLREKRAGLGARPRPVPHPDAVGRERTRRLHAPAEPWLPLAVDFVDENVANLGNDSKSILSLYKALIALRRKVPELVTGAYEAISAQGNILLYRRRSDGKVVIVALNLGAEPVSVTSSSIGFGREILLSTFLDRTGEPVRGTLDLRGNEGVIIS